MLSPRWDCLQSVPKEVSKTVVTCVTTGYDLTKGKLNIDYYSFSLISQINLIANLFIVRRIIHSKKSV